METQMPFSNWLIIDFLQGEKKRKTSLLLPSFFYIRQGEIPLNPTPRAASAHNCRHELQASVEERMSWDQNGKFNCPFFSSLEPKEWKHVRFPYKCWADQKDSAKCMTTCPAPSPKPLEIKGSFKSPISSTEMGSGGAAAGIMRSRR